MKIEIDDKLIPDGFEVVRFGRPSGGDWVIRPPQADGEFGHPEPRGVINWDPRRVSVGSPTTHEVLDGRRRLRLPPFLR